MVIVRIDNSLIKKLEKRFNNKELKELKEHILEENGLIRDTVNQTTKNTTWIKAFRWLIGIGISLIAVILTRLFGFW